MSLSEIRNVVLLFSNPVWSGASTVPSTIIRNLTALSSDITYNDRIDTNLTTLTTTNAQPRNGIIQGLLYVPDLDEDPACDNQQYDFIPRNVTRRDNLPPTNYNLIAIAPWFSIDCTSAYLASARLDPIRAFIFYKPNNSSNKPQDADSPVWNLDDGGDWVNTHKFPVFAISGLEGNKMMEQLSLYSGDIDDIPHGDDINNKYGPNEKDYVRVWTELAFHENDDFPDLWVFVLIVIGALILVISAVSLTMHLIQRRRRLSLQRRVASGEVDLEAMGIKRLTVPESHVHSFPIFTYNADPDSMNPPSTPNSRHSRNGRRQDQTSVNSIPTVRSKRSSLRGTTDTTATNDQPTCHICLTDFDHRVTAIRELPCGHIYHPQCIDEFLIKNSSLCPMCKHSMLPHGYSPRVSNAMVRRERALRRLRERVELDDLSDESTDSKIKAWSRRFFMPTAHGEAAASRMVTLKNARRNTNSGSSNDMTLPIVTIPAPTSRQIEPSSAVEDQPATITPATPAKPKPRRSRPFPLTKLPTQPEDSELKTTSHVGRSSPSSFARQRMREIAASNAPFDDPDHNRPLWRRGLSKVFPGYI